MQTLRPADSRGHADMAILSYVPEGVLEHRASIGTGSIIRSGEVQRMTAGTGIRHSEFNTSKTDPVHFLQIWIMPEQEGLAPGYEQKTFPGTDGKAMQLVGSRDGRNGSLTIHQDVDLYRILLDEGDKAGHTFAPGRLAWLQVARGSLRMNGTTLDAGDGLALREVDSLSIRATGNSKALLFDMTP